MAYNAGSIYLDVVPSFDGFQRALNRGVQAQSAGQNAGRDFSNGFGGSIGNIAKSVGKTLATVGGVTAGIGATAVTSLIKTGIAYNDLEQRSRAAFKTILGSADAANQMMDKIREFGKTSPFPRQAFISATQQLLGFGFAAEDIIPTLKTINDTTAAVGGNADTIATLTDVFAKIKSQGKITGEEVNRLGAIGVNAVDILAKASGKTGEAIRKEISKGSIDAGTAIKVLTDGMNERFAGASDNVKNTFGGAVDRVKGAFRDLGSALAAPFVDPKGGGYAVIWANLLADKIRVLEKQAPDFIAKVQAGMQGLADLLIKGDFTTNFREVFGVEEDAPVVGFLLGVRDAVIAISDAIKSGDYSSFGTAFRSIGESLSNLGPVFAAFKDSLPLLGAELKLVAEGLGFLAQHADTVAKIIPILIGVYVAYRLSLQALNVILALTRYQQLVQTILTRQSILANRELAASNYALIASQRGITVAELKEQLARESNNRSKLASIASNIRMAVTSAAARVAMIAGAVATGVATAAQWALNAAMTANPIGIVIVAIAALVAAFILLYKNSDTVRAFIERLWGALKDGAIAVVGFFTGSVVPFFQDVWEGLKTGVSAVGNAFQAAFDFIQKVLTPFKDFFVGLWDGFIFPIFDLLIHIVQFVVPIAFQFLSSVVSTVWGAISGFISSAWTFLRDQVFGPVIDWVQNKLVFAFNVYKDAVLFVWGAISGAVSAVWTFLRDRVFSPVIDWVQNKLVFAFNVYRDVAISAWDKIKGPINAVWTFLRDNVFNPLKNFVTDTIPKAFQTGVDAIGRAWDFLKDKAKAPVRFLVDTVINGALVDNFNKLADFFGSKKMSRIELPKGFATGGHIRGPGSGTSDSIPAWLSNNEYVIKAASVRKYGTGFLDMVNQGKFPGFATGGLVAFGRLLQSKGFRVSEHPAFGGVHPVHTKNSKHYSGQAIDVNYGPGGKSKIETDAINGILSLAKQYGLRTIWQTSGHYDHAHFDTSESGDLLGKIINGITGAFSDPAGFLTGAVQNLLGQVGDSPMAGIVGDVGRKVLTNAVDKVKSFLSSIGDSFTGGGNGGSGVQRWRPVVEQALGILGLPGNLVDTTLRRMNQESGGNPRAINNSDINAKRGTPSKGLMQVIDPTFRSNALAPYNKDIYDPLSNILASMRYALGRYGSLPAAYNRKGGYASGGLVTPLLHDQGGWLQPGLSLIANKTRKPEAILNQQQFSDLSTLAARGVSGGDTFQINGNFPFDAATLARNIQVETSRKRSLVSNNR